MSKAITPVAPVAASATAEFREFIFHISVFRMRWPRVINGKISMNRCIDWIDWSFGPFRCKWFILQCDMHWHSCGSTFASNSRKIALFIGARGWMGGGIFDTYRSVAIAKGNAKSKCTAVALGSPFQLSAAQPPFSLICAAFIIYYKTPKLVVQWHARA